MSQATRLFPVGDLPAGPLNSICDVAGLRVGHVTLSDGDLRTGVTAILPHEGDPFREKVLAASHVVNGFGKSVGLVQLDELGQLETPILLTNTLSVAACAEHLVRRALAANPRIGRQTGTVNPVVGECNDGWLSDIRALAVTQDHAAEAIAKAAVTFERGSVGAGTGMSCFGFKGGIGTSSRVVTLDKAPYAIGVLVLSNFGRAGDLRLPDGRRPAPPREEPQPERGSVMIVVATDIPLEHRQLQRVIRRAGAGIARLGSVWGHGSGDIVIGFSTARRIKHEERADLVATTSLNESRIDALFHAVADATEEAVLDSMLSSPAMTGRDGHRRPSLRDALAQA